MAKRILAVDDDPRILEIVNRFLKEAGYEVRTTDQPVEVAQVALEFQPDLLLLDIKMPGKDGYAVLDELRANAKTRNIPVIIITAKAIAEKMLDDSYYGLNLILPKPFTKQELVSLVNQRLDPAQGNG